MTPQDRVQVARQVYWLAVRKARREPSPSSWARLLTAARNLRGAEAAAERARRYFGTHQ